MSKQEAQEEAGQWAGEEDEHPPHRAELGKHHPRDRLIGVLALQPKPTAPGDGPQHPALPEAPEGVERQPEADAEDDGARPDRARRSQVGNFVHQDEHTQSQEGNQSRHAV